MTTINENERVSQLLAHLTASNGRLKEAALVDKRATTPLTTHETMANLVMETATFYLLQKGQKLIVPPEWEAFMPHWIAYLNNDSTGVFDPRKGMCLLGKTSIGKTFLFQVARAIYQKLKIKEHFFQEVAFIDLYQKERGKEKGLGDIANYIFKKQNIYYDDLYFNTDNIQQYGNSIDLGAEIIHARHHEWELNPTLRTHFSSNLTPDALQIRLDGTPNGRLYSRLAEMSNIYFWEGEHNFRL